MKKAVGISRQPWALPALAGFILGTLFGLFALGWGLFPVQWVDASPVDLSSAYQEDYLRAAIDSYGRNQDVQAAQYRYLGLAISGPELLSRITGNPGKQTADDIAKFSAVVAGGSVPAATPASTVTTAVDDNGKSTIVTMLVGLCVMMLVIGGALIYLLFFRNKKKIQKVAEEEEPAQGYVYDQIEQVGQVEEPAVEQAVPFRSEPVLSPEPAHASSYAPVSTAESIAQFMTSYNLGDDLYDDTFSIDAANGEFLGECGAGISDTIGVGDPKNISSIEVWLFDKNDIQTVTKVMMSSAVFNDASARQRLSIRGEPVLAEPGKIVVLETATLRMEARILDMNYGRSANLPAESYFDRMSIELNIYQK
jgi:hypothetical protein